MTPADIDDPLTKTTARLSISTMEGEYQRHQVRDFLKSDLNYARRDSAVSISSFNDDDEHRESPIKENLRKSPSKDGLRNASAKDGSDSKDDLRNTSSKDGSDNDSLRESSPGFLGADASSRTSKRRRSSAHAIAILTQRAKQPKTNTPVNETEIPLEEDVVAKPKKQHKKKLKKALAPAKIEVNPTSLTPKLKIDSIRNFIVSVLCNTALDKRFPLKLSNRKPDHKVVLCFAPGLSKDDFGIPGNDGQFSKPQYVDDLQFGDDLHFFKNAFDCVHPSSSPGNKEALHSAMHAVLNVPITTARKNQLVAKSKAHKLILDDLLMTRDEMVTHEYPLHSSLFPADDDDYPSSSDEEDDSDEWVETQEFEHEGSRTFSLDCEFCRTANGMVLTRISVIDFNECVVLDTLVKPDEEITDYLTKYSGITELKLQGITTTLKEVQQKLLSIVSSKDILIGQSLQSDFKVLKLKHPRVIDTALIYDHPRGLPMKPSLRWLSEKHLGKLIQQGEATGDGHSSVEDAKACLRLVKLKLIEGSLFGKNFGDISIFEKLNEDTSKPVKSAIIDYSPIRDWDNDNSEHNSHLSKFKCTNDDEVIDYAIQNLDAGCALSILKLRELEFNSGWSPVPKDFSGYLRDNVNPQDDKISSPFPEDERRKIIARLNQRLQRLYDHLPENTVLIVNTVSNDPREVFRLHAVRREFQNLQRDGADMTNLSPNQNWTFDRRVELTHAVNYARACLSFVGIKPSESTPPPSN